MSNLSIWINVTDTDTALNESGGDWIQYDPNNDIIIFSNGSDVVADGLAIPSQSEIIAAGMILDSIQQIVPKYFLADASANILREIPLMGNTIGRYVVAFEFDNATVTEPVLEIWDSNLLTTIDDESLGDGTPSSSWWKGIVTTSGAPSSNWTGSSLAGSSSSHFLLLNNGSGALSIAGTLYANLKIVIPASATTGFLTSPVIAVKWI